jgi:hypothetical protein
LVGLSPEKEGVMEVVLGPQEENESQAVFHF